MSAGAVRADVVERRGAEPALAGTVTLVDDAGVRVRTESGASHFVPWDRVRRVESSPHASSVEARAEVATDLWRARTRVERGDTALAEPLLERLFERYRGQTHETALVVAEGLLRCRLARGANAAAVIPALEAARLRRAGVVTASYAMLEPAIDDETDLCPPLAPAWVDDRALPAAARDLAGYAADDAVIAAMAAAYGAAIAHQLETPVPAVADGTVEPVDHPGVELLRLCAALGADDPAARSAARDRARARLDEAEPWIDGWCRYALGASLAAESGRGRRQRGLVQMLHVPARHGRALAYLSGLALHGAANRARAEGDTSAAAAFEAELARSYPGHPARSPNGRPRTTDPGTQER